MPSMFIIVNAKGLSKHMFEEFLVLIVQERFDVLKHPSIWKPVIDPFHNLRRLCNSGEIFSYQ